MPLPIVARIGLASKAAWPSVQAAVATTMRSLQELAGIADEVVPKVEEYVARSENASIRRRKICEETIWTLANLGWLRTGGERAVVLAAKNWIDADPQAASPQELDAVDEKLADAVLALPEYMTQPTPREVPA